ncbi:unnamed protein product [Paramecium pentaurelia]|uniref:Phosphatidylcholine transfer protein n=1 Tax=Paramecium pentaurelia TaxID=43138 RepID=A0A8S1UNG4_9CILI|nr:unnamed protein product [Paramecium pentaurelia]
MINMKLKNPKSLTSLVNLYLKNIHNPMELKDLINQLLSDATFLPIYGLTDQQKLEHKTIFTNIQLGNNQNLGTIIGMTVLGVIGFLALGFTFLGAIGGGAIGIILGRYLGRKISKKIATKGINLTEFDIFIIRVKCLLKWGKLIMIKYTNNINLQRFCVQRILTEIKPLLHYKYFDEKFQKESHTLLVKIREWLSKEQSIYALCLSYKLTKEYIQIVEQKIIYSKFSNYEISYVLNETVSDVLIPFLTLFQDAKQYEKNDVIRLLIQKIKQLQVNKIVLKCQQSYFDQQLSIEFIKMFAAKLNQKVKVEDLEKFLQIQNYRQQQQNREQNSPSKSQQRRKSQGDMVSINEDIDQEFQAQVPLIMKNQVRARAKSYDDKNDQQFTSKQQSQLIIQQNQQQQQQQQQPLQQSDQIIFDNTEKRGSQCIPENLIQQSQLQQILCLQMEHSQQQSQIHRVQQQAQDNQINSDRTYQLSAELEEKFKLLVDLIEEPIDGWEIILKKENLIIYKTFKPGNPAVFVKGHSDLIGITIDVLLKAIHNEKYRQKWDKILLSFQVLERESAIVDIIYYYVKSPPCVDNREFCQKRILKYDFPKPGQTCLLYFSVEHSKAPKFKGHIRAETLISGYILESIPGGSRLYFCSNNDVKGDIPKSLVNYVASRAPISWINSLRKGCEDYNKIMQQIQQ